MRAAGYISAMCAMGYMLGGCAEYVAVETPKLAVPVECKQSAPGELPEVPPLPGPTASADQVNRHWARYHRLTARPAYRRLYRKDRVCSRYAKGV